MNLKKIIDSSRELKTVKSLENWLNKSKPGEYGAEFQGHKLLLSIDEESSNGSYWTSLTVDGKTVFEQYESDIPAIPSVDDLPFEVKEKKVSSTPGPVQELIDKMKKNQDLTISVRGGNLIVRGSDIRDWSEFNDDFDSLEEQGYLEFLDQVDTGLSAYDKFKIISSPKKITLPDSLKDLIKRMESAGLKVRVVKESLKISGDPSNYEKFSKELTECSYLEYEGGYSLRELGGSIKEVYRDWGIVNV